MTKLYNRFSIRVVFDHEFQRDQLKEALEEKVEDLEFEKKNTEYDGVKYYEVILRCDSGASTLVNGTSFRWDPDSDPTEEDVISDFISYLKDFPL